MFLAQAFMHEMDDLYDRMDALHEENRVLLASLPALVATSPIGISGKLAIAAIEVCPEEHEEARLSRAARRLTMDWGSLAAFALLLTVAIIVLRLLWYWLIIILVFGPPSYAGILAGHFVGVQFDSVGTGVLAAVLVSGCLIETVRCSLRRVR
jgi:hypothetical protein